LLGSKSIRSASVGAERALDAVGGERGRTVVQSGCIERGCAAAMAPTAAAADLRNRLPRRRSPLLLHSLSLPEAELPLLQPAVSTCQQIVFVLTSLCASVGQISQCLLISQNSTQQHSNYGTTTKTGESSTELESTDGITQDVLLQA
jgi:hypothetical protein